MIYPVPAVLVTVPTPDGKGNILTIAWTGTICTNPAMTYISVRPERYSYPFLRESGEFVINLTNEKLVRAADYCGVRSGRDVDKFAECHLTRETAEHVSAPMIAESPVNIECRVREVHEYGSELPSRRKVAGNDTLFHIDDPDRRYVSLLVRLFLTYGNMQSAQFIIDDGILQHIRGILRFFLSDPGNSDIGDVHML